MNEAVCFDCLADILFDTASKLTSRNIKVTA